MSDAHVHTISLGLSRRLGDLMVESETISKQQLQEALDIQRKEGGKLGAILVGKDYITEEKLLQFLSQQCGISYVSLEKLGPITDDIIKLVPESIARQHVLLPIRKAKDKLTIAVADPLNVLVLDDLKLMTGLDVDIVLAAESEIQATVEKYYGTLTTQGALEDILKQTGQNGAESIENVELTEEEKLAGDNIITLKKSGEDAPIIQMVNVLLANAIKAKASDIHIEPFPKQLKVRYRIDGVLHEQPAPPKRFQNALASRIKIMATLDISEHRVPQDGRIKLKIDGREIDLRVSILPCAPGEKIVMRILDSSGLRVKLEDLGFEPEANAVFQKCMRAPYGINLITGPTGSGKSTTLYSALSQLNHPDVNIMTVEDPVEYQLPGINQVQVNADVGLTFAAGLRSFLRQDPDIIMVGEIRDLETINIAINAALTGHLVFSTLHTNDASGAITRMGMMGIEPFLMSSALLMVVAQRLTRSICKDCREIYEVDAAWLKALGVPEQLMQVQNGKVPLARGRGCEECAKTGYRGRLGLYEILEVNDALRQLILAKANANQIKEMGRKQGMLTLRDCAIRKVLGGLTTVEEMIRLTASEVEK
ncbi:MAG: type II secretion system ATPase GspE [Elusimicrobia bacterium]|nr:type II secretion system ATPase GspE [Elusimicrobiota bacterium]